MVLAWVSFFLSCNKSVDEPPIGHSFHHFILHHQSCTKGDHVPIQVCFPCLQNVSVGNRLNHDKPFLTNIDPGFLAIVQFSLYHFKNCLTRCLET